MGPRTHRVGNGPGAHASGARGVGLLTGRVGVVVSDDHRAGSFPRVPDSRQEGTRVPDHGLHSKGLVGRRLSVGRPFVHEVDSHATSLLRSHRPATSTDRRRAPLVDRWRAQSPNHRGRGAEAWWCTSPSGVRSPHYSTPILTLSTPSRRHFSFSASPPSPHFASISPGYPWSVRSCSFSAIDRGSLPAGWAQASVDDDDRA